MEVVDIAAGGAHSACITASGELFTWGKGRYGRLGHGDSEDQLKPKLVGELCLSLTAQTCAEYVLFPSGIQMTNDIEKLRS